MTSPGGSPNTAQAEFAAERPPSPCVPRPAAGTLAAAPAATAPGAILAPLEDEDEELEDPALLSDSGDEFVGPPPNPGRRTAAPAGGPARLSSPASAPPDPDSLRRRMAGPSEGKAGLEGIDKAKVNEIIYEASKGSAFFENEARKDAQIAERIQNMLGQLEELRARPDGGVSLCDLARLDQEIATLKSDRDLSQCIVHVDMDAFYASVEERDQPELKTKPMAVGTGVLTTANYVARKYGVRSAMPSFIALKLCPELVLVPLHFDKYITVAKEVRSIFANYDPNFAPMSLDEAYLNITNYLSASGLKAEEAVHKMREEIYRKTSLTASAGIAPNKMLAKICSDLRKPNGQYFLCNDPTAVVEFVEALPVRKVPGIGRVTETLLNSIGVVKLKDVLEQRGILMSLLSRKTLNFLIRAALGIGSTRVEERAERKSIGAERTFRAMDQLEAMDRKLMELAEMVEKDLAKKNLEARAVTLKLKRTNFELLTRCKTLPKCVYTAAELHSVGMQLLTAEYPISIRLLGISASRLQTRRRTTKEELAKFLGLPSATQLVSDASSLRNAQPPVPPEPKAPGDRTPPQQPEMHRTRCPVCAKEIVFADNAEVNAHVDLCLNREQVRVLQRQPLAGADAATAGGPSKRQPPASSPPAADKGKRPRAANLPSERPAKTLLSYFGGRPATGKSAEGPNGT